MEVTIKKNLLLVIHTDTGSSSGMDLLSCKPRELQGEISILKCKNEEPESAFLSSLQDKLKQYVSTLGVDVHFVDFIDLFSADIVFPLITKDVFKSKQFVSVHPLVTIF
jgi:hypothetical protein